MQDDDPLFVAVVVSQGSVVSALLIADLRDMPVPEVVAATPLPLGACTAADDSCKC